MNINDVKKKFSDRAEQHERIYVRVVSDEDDEDDEEEEEEEEEDDDEEEDEEDERRRRIHEEPDYEDEEEETSCENTALLGSVRTQIIVTPSLSPVQSSQDLALVVESQPGVSSLGGGLHRDQPHTSSSRS